MSRRHRRDGCTELEDRHTAREIGYRTEAVLGQAVCIGESCHEPQAGFGFRKRLQRRCRARIVTRGRTTRWSGTTVRGTGERGASNSSSSASSSRPSRRACSMTSGKNDARVGQKADRSRERDQLRAPPSARRPSRRSGRRIPGGPATPRASTSPRPRLPAGGCRGRRRRPRRHGRRRRRGRRGRGERSPRRAGAARPGRPGWCCRPTRPSRHREKVDGPSSARSSRTQAGAAARLGKCRKRNSTSAVAPASRRTTSTLAPAKPTQRTTAHAASMAPCSREALQGGAHVRGDAGVVRIRLLEKSDDLHHRSLAVAKTPDQRRGRIHVDRPRLIRVIEQDLVVELLQQESVALSRSIGVAHRPLVTTRVVPSRRCHSMRIAADRLSGHATSRAAVAPGMKPAPTGPRTRP